MGQARAVLQDRAADAILFLDVVELFLSFAVFASAAASACLVISVLFVGLWAFVKNYVATALGLPLQQPLPTELYNYAVQQAVAVCDKHWRLSERKTIARAKLDWALETVRGEIRTLLDLEDKNTGLHDKLRMLREHIQHCMDQLGLGFGVCVISFRDLDRLCHVLQKIYSYLLT